MTFFDTIFKVFFPERMFIFFAILLNIVPMLAPLKMLLLTILVIQKNGMIIFGIHTLCAVNGIAS